MNLYHVQDCRTWKKAPTGIRGGFIEQMRTREYSAGATQDAWDWYRAGWIDAVEAIGKAATINDKGKKK